MLRLLGFKIPKDGFRGNCRCSISVLDVFIEAFDTLNRVSTRFEEKQTFNL